MYKIRLNRRRWNLSTEMNWNNKPGLCSIVVHLTQTTAPEYYKPYMYKVYIKYTGGLFFWKATFTHNDCDLFNIIRGWYFEDYC